MAKRKLLIAKNRKRKRACDGCPPWLSLHAWRTHANMRAEDWEKMFDRYRNELKTPVSEIRGKVSRCLFYSAYRAWLLYEVDNVSQPRRRNISTKMLNQYREPFRVRKHDEDK